MHAVSRWGRIVVGVLGVSVVVQVVLVFTTRGQPFDLASYQLVDGWLHSDPWHVYSLGTATRDVRWPYPPGFFPVDDLAVRVAVHAHLEFIRVIRLFLVAGDLLLCGLAWWWLRPRLGEAKAA